MYRIASSSSGKYMEFGLSGTERTTATTIVDIFVTAVYIPRRPKSVQ